MVMESPFSQRTVTQLESSNMKLKQVKLVLISLFPFLSLCSHSLEAKTVSMEQATSMVREQFNSILNGRQSLPDGRKKAKLLKECKHTSQQ